MTGDVLMRPPPGATDVRYGDVRVPEGGAVLVRASDAEALCAEGWTPVFEQTSAED